MARRFVLGKRSNGDTGVFVSRAGYDAYTAADSNLILSVNRRVSSLLLLGYATSSGTVTLGVGARPVVILSTIASVFSSTGGSCKPSPLFFVKTGGSNVRSDAYARAVVASNGANMSITTSIKVMYEVYNEAWS